MHIVSVPVFGESKLRHPTGIFLCVVITECLCYSIFWVTLVSSGIISQMNKGACLRVHVWDGNWCFFFPLKWRKWRISPPSVHRHTGEIPKTERKDQGKHRLSRTVRWPLGSSDVWLWKHISCKIDMVLFVPVSSQFTNWFFYKFVPMSYLRLANFIYEYNKLNYT